MKRLLIPILGLMPLISLAGGYQVNLQGNKQTGMGHLGTSFYLGASSAYFNPAMMGLDSNKLSFEVGGSAIFGSVSYQNQETGISESTDNPVGTPFYFYGTYKINEKLSAGLGVYTPFGNSVKWGDDWSGKNLIQDISLQAIYIQPTLSYNISDKLSFGAGLTYVLGSFDINRAVPAPIGNNNSSNLQGDETGIGFNTGIYFKATEKLSLGLTYRSQVDIELENGDIDFTVDPALASSFPDGKFAATLPLPATTTLGLAYRVSDKLLLSVEGSFVEWSAYKSLDFDFENNTASLEDSENPRNYDDAIIVRIGGEYLVQEGFALRAGFYYDQSPITDEYFNPETPNSDNLGFTAGFSYAITANLGVDASFLYIAGLERESTYKPANFSGKYKGAVVIPGIGLNYKF